ncbi:peptidoglycan D,D-transpeptidase FtsI family protein [Gimibacter soli]|uniref:Penicillin-binding protein 2 n=1 Tax=Gimibacter soli TaxID=3024400 RepID=A0AAE9XV98_9PROT|nr:penicillin-binding protein 2 [Gimibacter soli]WCL55445.1 penicillin-binding protein 2 [Gimibacter soli]
MNAAAFVMDPTRSGYVPSKRRGDEQPVRSQLDMARGRLFAVMLLFLVGFMVMIGRTVELGMRENARPRSFAGQVEVPPVKVGRADIRDRNGEIMATNLRTSSLFADATQIRDAAGAAHDLVKILPQLSLADVESKLASGKKFVWLHRKLTPRQKWQVNALGNPAFRFEEEEERVYPHGRLASHIMGYVDVDGRGLGGVEHFFEDRLADPDRQKDALKLSIDMRVQYALADELETARRVHSAIGAAGLVFDVKTGEVVALVSLPDYDPNDIRGVSADQLFNRVTQGVYELGSTFKTFTFASALDQGVATLEDGYDATKPLVVGRFRIRDDHPKNRYLTVPEIFAFSSNIGTAQMALDVGTDGQRDFLEKLGMLRPSTVELTEVGAPMYPAPQQWKKISTMTISYGHGIAVSPLQLAVGTAAIVNGGRLIPATLVADSDGYKNATQVISEKTSHTMNVLLRMVVKKGTAGRADAVGYRVGGKTGTAEKPANGRYNRKALISSFMGVFPMDDPNYVVFALLDEPKGTKETYGFASGGWTAAPVVRNVVLRTAPLLGVAPEGEDEGLYQQVAMKINDKKGH